LFKLCGPATSAPPRGSHAWHAAPRAASADMPRVSGTVSAMQSPRTCLCQGGYANIEAGHAARQAMHQALCHGATRRPAGAAGQEGRETLVKPFCHLLRLSWTLPPQGEALRHTRKQPRYADAQSRAGTTRGHSRQVRQLPDTHQHLRQQSRKGTGDGALRFNLCGTPWAGRAAHRRRRRRASAAPATERRRQRNGLIPQYFLTSAVTTRMKAMPSEMPTASAARGAAGVSRSSHRRSKRRVGAAVHTSETRKRATGPANTGAGTACTVRRRKRASQACIGSSRGPRGHAAAEPGWERTDDLICHRHGCAQAPRACAERVTHGACGTRPAKQAHVARTLVSGSECLAVGG